MNETPTITLKATRINTILHKGDMLVSAYVPTTESIKALGAYQDTAEQFRLELEDETGEWMTGVKWRMLKIQVSDDRKALNLILVKEEK